MEEKNTFLFNEFLCVKLSGQSHKLILTMKAAINAPITKLSHPEFQENARSRMSYDLGYVCGIFRRNGFIISDIDLILPPLSEYVDLENTLRDEMREENIHLNVLIGIAIEVPNREVDENIDFIDTQIAHLKNRDSNQN